MPTSKGGGVFLLRCSLRLAGAMLVGTAIFIFRARTFRGDAITYDFLAWPSCRDGLAISITRASQPFVRVAGQAGMVDLVAAVYGRLVVTVAIQLMMHYLERLRGTNLLCAQHVFHIPEWHVSPESRSHYPSLGSGRRRLKTAPSSFCWRSDLVHSKVGEKRGQIDCSVGGRVVGLMALGFMSCTCLSRHCWGVYYWHATISVTSFVRSLLHHSPGTGLDLYRRHSFGRAQFERYGNLQAIQRSRLTWPSASPALDGRRVSSTSGALTTVPTGLLYLCLPLPVAITSLAKASLSGDVNWWTHFRVGFRSVFCDQVPAANDLPILIFTVMLTLAYSVFRQRGTAIANARNFCLLFIFVAVGFVLVRRARREKAAGTAMRKELALQQAATYKARPGRTSA